MPCPSINLLDYVTDIKDHHKCTQTLIRQLKFGNRGLSLITILLVQLLGCQNMQQTVIMMLSSFFLLFFIATIVAMERKRTHENYKIAAAKSAHTFF